MQHTKTMELRQVYEDELNSIQSEMNERIEEVKQQNLQLTMDKQNLLHAIYDNKEKHVAMSRDYNLFKIEISQYNDLLKTEYSNMQQKVIIIIVI